MRYLLFLALLAFSQSAQYSELIASRAVQLSASVYNISIDHMQANTCPHCYREFKVIKQFLANQILAIVGVDRKLKFIMIVYRGTSNLQNLITDSQALMRPYGKKCQQCKVHYGFYQSYKLLSQQNIEKTVHQLMKQFPDYGILFTGHSLGAAVAHISAVRFKQKNKGRGVYVYTFGQPRVGNIEYADYTDTLIDNHFRIVNKKDFVPHKPAYMACYRHSGYEIWYLNGTRSDYKGCKGDSNYCSNTLGNYFFDYSFQDHVTYGYIQLYLKTQPNKNIYPGFRQNNEGKPVKRKLIKSQNETFNWKQVALGVQNELFEIFQNL